MRIGELFVSLGFDIRGRQGLVDVESGMKEAAVTAGKLTIGVAAINAAMLVLITTAARAGVALKNFRQETGLDTVELQRWQHMAAVNDVSAEKLADQITSLQDARAKFALGQPEAVGAWGLLGVNPIQDPFKVLADLRVQLRKFQDVGVARNLAGQAGISSDIFRLLVASNEEFERWNRNLALLPDQTEKLRRLDAAWKSLRFALDSIRNQFVSGFAPVLTFVAKGLEKMAEWLTIVTNWLSSASPVAKLAAWAIGFLAAEMLGLGVALAVVTASLAILLGLLTLFSPVLISVGLAIAPVALGILAIAAAIAALILEVDDLWTALHGGKSVIYGPIFRTIRDFFSPHKKDGVSGSSPEAGPTGAFLSVQKLTSRAFLGILSLRNRALTQDGVSGSSPEAIAAAPAAAAGRAQITQNNDIDINLFGSDGQAADARGISRTLASEISGAAYQMPVRNY